MVTPIWGSCRRSEPVESEATSKISLRSGVIAFEHNVNLRSMQVMVEFAFQKNSFTASSFHFCDPNCDAFAASGAKNGAGTSASSGWVTSEPVRVFLLPLIPREF